MAKKVKSQKKASQPQKCLTTINQKLQSVPLNIVLAAFFFTLTLCLLNLENLQFRQKVLGLQTQIKAEQQTLMAWEQILQERPDYRDGWLQLSALYLKMGDKIKAKEALLRAKAIDPNNENILSLEKLLEN